MEDNKHNNPKTIIISEDIVEEIFYHLPIKPLARFKVLSKKWRSMIESAYFSHKRLVRTGLPTPNVKLLVVSQQLSAKFDKQDSDSTTLCLNTFSRYDDHNNGKYCPSSSSYYTFPDDPIDKSQKKTIQVLGSCDGLVLIRIYDDFRYIYLINPTTKEHMKLSPAFSQWPFTLNFTLTTMVDRPWRELSQSVIDYEGELVKIMLFLAGFGKDIVTNSYMVVLIYSRLGDYDSDCFKANVISFDSGKQSDTGFYSLDNHSFCKEQSSVYANGSLFWLTIKYRTFSMLLLAIDLHTEKFRWIMLPKCYTNYTMPTSIEMWNLNDRLCISDVLNGSNLGVWSLQQEYPPDEKWEIIYSISFISTSQLHKKYWMLGLAAAYFGSVRKNRYQVSLARQRTIFFSPTMISPASLML
ncbi:PREDICTED: LOW QUALITY PROTEIN: putative F-box protein At1g71320 [Camelina sativa]|uniref:LOW QUALITY PROTEIN: putative F-box protein At1g71320 n=1 Tax=Camelina sativa TaxID=90675 RepID=A0ABM0STE1_CAMSA|nr:PREDICTED: LOW QUALITY PROTEIN: putative F-box protein At1g71320 [Camelina sativa]